ncbi:MAG TPA: hypothetical protein VF452_09685 [Candidatus Binatia bacterium]
MIGRSDRGLGDEQNRTLTQVGVATPGALGGVNGHGLFLFESAHRSGWEGGW